MFITEHLEKAENTKKKNEETAFNFTLPKIINNCIFWLVKAKRNE